MSANPRDIEQRKERLRIVPQPKESSGGTLPHGSKDREIESIKRTLYNAIDKLEKLTSK